jgi:hypothetical protein
MVREFRGCHASHIFDVKFDVGRIVRCVNLSLSFDVLACLMILSNDQHISRPEDRHFGFHSRPRRIIVCMIIYMILFLATCSISSKN